MFVEITRLIIVFLTTAGGLPTDSASLAKTSALKSSISASLGG